VCLAVNPLGASAVSGEAEAASPAWRCSAPAAHSSGGFPGTSPGEGCVPAPVRPLGCASAGPANEPGVTSEAGGANEPGVAAEAGGANEPGVTSEAGGANEPGVAPEAGGANEPGEAAEAGAATQAGVAGEAGASEAAAEARAAGPAGGAGGPEAAARAKGPDPATRDDPGAVDGSEPAAGGVKEPDGTDAPDG
jgi:hypothetical protein